MFRYKRRWRTWSESQKNWRVDCVSNHPPHRSAHAQGHWRKLRLIPVKESFDKSDMKGHFRPFVEINLLLKPSSDAEESGNVTFKWFCCYCNCLIESLSNSKFTGSAVAAGSRSILHHLAGRSQVAKPINFWTGNFVHAMRLKLPREAATTSWSNH